jgi:multicomponent Na+:H+ antiporter subunit G
MIVSSALLVGGTAFYISGTVALIRFPDLHCRLHALTKADNLGLGLIVAGLMFQAPSLAEGFKLLLVWLLVLVASASVCFLIADEALRIHGRQSREGK